MNENQPSNDFQNQQLTEQEPNTDFNTYKQFLKDSNNQNYLKISNPFLRANMNLNNSSNQNDSNMNFNFTKNLFSKKSANNNFDYSSIENAKLPNLKENTEEINIFELGLSGIKENSVQENLNKNNNSNNLNNLNNNFYLNNLSSNNLYNQNSENLLSSNLLINNKDWNNFNDPNANNDQIIYELKSLNSTFKLWGFDFNLIELANIKDKFFQSKLINILKSLLLKKQSDDNSKLEESLKNNNLETQLRNFESKVEKLNKNFLGKEEKMQRQSHEKDEKIKQLEKKLKEKEEEKSKVLALLESEKNENAKAKLKFSQLALQMKTKEKEFDNLNQRLLKYYNSNNADPYSIGANNNIKICNGNLNYFANATKNKKNISANNNNNNSNNAASFENKEFLSLKLYNNPTFDLKATKDNYLFNTISKESFCFYVNTVLSKGGELGIENSLKNKVENICKANDHLEQTNINNIPNILNNNCSENNFYNENTRNDLISKADIFGKDGLNNVREFSCHLFNLRLDAKNDALKTLEILYEAILEINKALKSFALKKNETKLKLKKKIFGTLGLSSDSDLKQMEDQENEDNLKRCFDNLIWNEKLKFFNYENAFFIKNQILTNVKICEKLFFSVEELKEYESNPEELVSTNTNNEIDDFQIVLFKNNIGDYYERFLDLKNKGNKGCLEKIYEEQLKQFNCKNTDAEVTVKVKSQSFLDSIAQNNILFKEKGSNMHLGSAFLDGIKGNKSKFTCETGKSYFTNILDELIKIAKEDQTQIKDDIKNTEEIQIKNESSKDLFIGENLNFDQMDVVDESEKDIKNSNDASNLISNNSSNNLSSISNTNVENKKILVNDFSFNKNYFEALCNISSTNNLTFQNNFESNLAKKAINPKIIIRNPARKLNDKIYENFINFLYQCIKSNEFYIDFFNMFLENEKINLGQNIKLESNTDNDSNTNPTNLIDFNSINDNKDKYSKLFFYKNFQNMLLNMIDYNDERIKELHKSYALKYEYMEEKIVNVDYSISKIQQINEKMQKNLKFLDEQYDMLVKKYGS